MLEAIGAVVGLVYLWLECKASIHLWIAGIIMPAIYVVVFYQSELYTQLAINAYFLLASLYGWYTWKYASAKELQGKPLPIRHTPIRLIVGLTAVAVAIFVVLYSLLQHLHPAPTTMWESLSTTLSIIGMWMLAKKYVEQWWVWIATDIISAHLYWISELPYTALLYLLYTIVAFYGFREWKKIMTTQSPAQP